MAFMTLYWTGMRLGELLALNPKDVDLKKRTIAITKSYQRLGKKDVITPPKTSKSKRVITIPGMERYVDTDGKAPEAVTGNETGTAGDFFPEEATFRNKGIFQRKRTEVFRE